MKDKQGIDRGKCTSAGCECTEYMKPDDPKSVRCEYCEHTPVRHMKMVNLGACTNCEDCPSYESEDSNSYPECAYCECPAQYHKGAEKLFPKSTGQSSSSQSPSTIQVPAGAAGLQEGATGQLAISQVNSALKCKLPGCPKACFMEVNGRVHDFCSKAHAVTYIQQTSQQPKQPTAQPPGALTTMPEAPLKPPQPPPSSGRPVSGKVCTKCGKKPSNPGKGWCQDCYVQSKQSW